MKKSYKTTVAKAQDYLVCRSFNTWLKSKLALKNQKRLEGETIRRLKGQVIRTWRLKMLHWKIRGLFIWSADVNIECIKSYICFLTHINLKV